MLFTELFEGKDACPVCGQTPCNCTHIAEGLRDPKDNPCWKGYHPVGTKKKGGRTVPNCVPKEGVEEGYLSNPGQEDSPVTNAITRRIIAQRTDLLAKYGPEKVAAAIDEVADFVGDVEEIGSSDVSGWVRHVEQMLGNMEESQVNEISADPRYLSAAERSRSQAQDTQRQYWKSPEEKAAARQTELKRDKGIAGYSKRHRAANPEMYPKVTPRPAPRLRDPSTEYSDDYSVWAAGRRDTMEQGVAEGVEIVDQDSDLDQQVFTLNVDGKTVSFTYWDYENNFQNPDIKDIYQQAREQLGKKLSPEQIKSVARSVFKSFKSGVAEAAGLYGPFIVTINTGERPQSRTKTKKFRREDDAILWAQDWLEDFSQYPFATAEVTDPDGNVVWTTDEEDSPWASAKPGVAEAQPEKIGGRYNPDDFDAMVLRLKKLAGAGPMKTVWDPQKRVYKNVPRAVQPGEKK